MTRCKELRLNVMLCSGRKKWSGSWTGRDCLCMSRSRYGAWPSKGDLNDLRKHRNFNATGIFRDAILP